MNKSKTRILISILILTLAVFISACGGEEVDVDDPPRELPEDTESLEMLAKLDLMLETGIDPEEMKTVEVEYTEFADPSLGVPQPGAVYDQVITPGYIIILEAEGELYEYHASAQIVVRVPDETGE